MRYKNPTANIALTYILAVFLVARFTDGYSFGLFSSFVGVVCVNFLFTYPYFALDFTMAGYPITFVAMFSISSITSAITSNMKTQARVLAEREKMLMEAEKERCGRTCCGQSPMTSAPRLPASSVPVPYIWKMAAASGG